MVRYLKLWLAAVTILQETVSRLMLKGVLCMDAEPRHRFLKATGVLRLRSNLNIILRYVSFLTQVLAAISLVIGPRLKHAGRMYKMCSK